jgi:hypothetical protein
LNPTLAVAAIITLPFSEHAADCHHPDGELVVVHAAPALVEQLIELRVKTIKTEPSAEEATEMQFVTRRLVAVQVAPESADWYTKPLVPAAIMESPLLEHATETQWLLGAVVGAQDVPIYDVV